MCNAVTFVISTVVFTKQLIQAFIPHLILIKCSHSMSGMYFAGDNKGLIVVYDDAMLHDFMIRPSLPNTIICQKSLMFNYSDDRMLSAMKQRIFVNDWTE